MLHLKNIFEEEKFYFSIMLSLMLNTVCSRLIDQTDLVMMRRISETVAASLISVKSISLIDFIVSLTVVPIFGILLRKAGDIEQKEKTAAVLVKKFFFCTILTTLLCSLLYPLFIYFSLKDPELKYLCKYLILPLVLNLPCKMMQFIFSTFLCVFQRANFVSLFWIVTVVINFMLNSIFIKFFGYVGCLFSTVVVTFVVSFSFFVKLSKEFNLMKNILCKRRKYEVVIPVNPILSEGLRILAEQAASYVFFFMSIRFCKLSDFTDIGIISSLLPLLLVPSVASMRATALSLSKEKPFLKRKITLNCFGATVISLAFIGFFPFIIRDLYGIKNYTSSLWMSFRISIFFTVLLKSVSAVLRGSFQFELRQNLLFKIDILIIWVLYIPVCLMIFAFSRQELYPFVLCYQAFVELVIIFIFYRKNRGVQLSKLI